MSDVYTKTPTMNAARWGAVVQDIYWGVAGHHPGNAHAAAYLEAVRHDLIEPCSCGGWRFTPKGIRFAPDDFAQPVPPRDRCNVCWPLDDDYPWEDEDEA